MRARFVTLICCAVLGAISLSASTLAQQKTVKACIEEWRANKAANQAAGISERDYVAKCKGGAATATAPSEAPVSPKTSGGAAAPSKPQAKTVKACIEEWRANKAANQAAGITERDYVAKCKGGAATATAPSEAPVSPKTSGGAVVPSKPQAKTVKACIEEWRANKAANQAAGISERDYVAKCKGGAATATAPSEAPASPKTSGGAAAPSKPIPPAASNQPAGAGQFATEARAKAHCPGDIVVWANTSSQIYHFSGNKNYGNTKQGAYMCEKDSVNAGMRAAKNETHP